MDDLSNTIGEHFLFSGAAASILLFSWVTVDEDCVAFFCSTVEFSPLFAAGTVCFDFSFFSDPHFSFSFYSSIRCFDRTSILLALSPFCHPSAYLQETSMLLL